MKSTVKTLSFALSLCVSLSALTACNTSGTPMSSTNPQQSGAQSGLSLEAQAALASYHDADASFSDTSRVASSGQFKTKQLLGGGDGSGSGSISIGVGASGSGSTSGGTSNGSTSGSGSVGVDANASGSGSSGSSDSSSSGSGSVGVGANAGASGSTTGSNTGSGSTSGSGSLGVGVDANASASGSGSTGSGSTSGSGNLGVGVDANASGSGSTTGSNGSSSGSGNLGVGTNVNATGSSSNGSSSGSSNGSLNLGTSLNANAMLDSFNRFSSIDQNRSRFTSNANSGISFDSQGNSTIDDSRLASDITSRLNANADLQSMRNSSASQANSMAGAQISADSLLRLRNRNFQATGMDGGSRTNADGSVTSTFMTQFVGNGTDRRISYASQQQGNVRVGAEAVLTETGTGFTRSGSRQTDFQADGSAQVTTSVMTTLSNGDRLEVLEDRFTNAQGVGSGFGSFRLTRNDGTSSSGDLRTMVTADGSLTTFFDSDNNNQDFALRSDANGALSLVGRGSNGSFGDNWSMLDFNTVLNSAIQASASRSGNRSASSANAAANTATAVTGSSSSN